MPHAPLLLREEHALVVTETVDPLVLTEIPVPCAAAGTAARASGSAAAAAAVRAERTTG
ncbi:hypothetical protein GCM10010276_06730 [Streptomyces longisporus]|uniref:Uncharacterized protein n=1 Tax=Streptomyces longisporus TaxID=1948 RepID=A0ABN3L1A4_STRLO